MNISLSFACGAVAALVALKLQESWRRRRAVDDKEGEKDGGDWVRVVTTPLTAAPLIARVASPKAGAIVTFSGVTRDNFEGQEVVRLEYEGFAPMAEREMAKICAEARRRWPDLTRVAMAHRLGVCPVQEASVIIAVSSPHRKDALEAAHFAIDRLKATVPVWKKEFYGGGRGGREEPGKWKENKEWHTDRQRQSSRRKLNVVCLHGITMSADMLRNWEAMRSLEEKCADIATFHYVTAPHTFEPNAFTRKHAMPNRGQQWFTDAPPDHGFGASCKAVTDFMDEKVVDGPADVLLGYSQGGLMAANVLQYLPDAAPFQRLRGAVFLHAPDFMGNAPSEKLCPSLKTLHVTGSRDAVVPPSNSAQLARRFVHFEEVTHDGLHYFTAPFPDTVLDKVHRFLASLHDG